MRRAAHTLHAVILLALIVVAAPVARAAFEAPSIEVEAESYRRGLIAAVTTRDSTPIPTPEILRRQTDDAMAAQRWSEAVRALQFLVGLNPNDTALWQELAQALTRESPRSPAATSATYNAFRTAADDPTRARLLRELGGLLERREQWRTAIRAYDESVRLDDDKDTADRRDFLRRQYGFRIVSTRAERDSDTPRICLEFSDPLRDSRRTHYADYLRISPEVPVEPLISGNQICLGGVAYGTQYEIRALPGLPSQTGDRLTSEDAFTVTVADRDASVAFRGRAYVLPRHGAGTVPLSTVNVSEVSVRLLRINDRNLMQQIVTGDLGNGLAGYELERVISTSGQLLWSGRMSVANEPNHGVLTGVPVTELLPQTEPGVYILAARNAAPADAEDPDDQWGYGDVATQWLVISDLGLTSYVGDGGMDVAVRSLQGAGPVAGTRLTLLARNNTVLGEATSGADGLAHFAEGLAHGTGGNRPGGVLAQTEAGDFTFLDLTEPAFDLTDRGVAGRPEPGPMDTYLYTERGVYRPGETVELVALLRDDRTRAMAGLPLTIRVVRPDGIEARSESLTDQGGGSYRLSLPLARTAHSGVWTATAYVDPEQPIGSVSFQVEDFVPTRVRMNLTSEAQVLVPGQTAEVQVNAEYLYGAPAIGLSGDASVSMVSDPMPWEEWREFRFGLAQESFSTRILPIEMEPTDDQGHSILGVQLPAVPDSSLPLRAEIRASLFDVGGRPINAILRLPVRRDGVWIGIRPLQTGRVEEGEPASFEVVALDGEGHRIAAPHLNYELIREWYDLQWFSQGGSWSYRLVVRDQGVGAGTVAVAADAPAQIVERVDYGRYRLEITDPETGAATSVRFDSGWWVSPEVSDTPDTLQVTLDRDHYRAGDTAQLHIEPPFAGPVLVVVASDRVLHTLEMDVPAEGAIAEFTVAEDWGPGAYVLATAFRPVTEGERAHGPGRAVGVAWFGLDMADRTLNVTLDMPQDIRPRQTVTVPVQVANVQPGQPAWLTLAAVDEGILLLTNFASPNPTEHYYGRRALGVGIRDAYGRLIVSEGTRGVLRSGGDGGENLAGPEVRPTRTVALFSGIVTLDDQGRAQIPLEIPDFNGELRLMAVAWSASAVGAASQPLIVRDPVVGELALPRFLAPGDRADLSLSLHNVSGPAGTYTVRLAAEGPARFTGSAEQTVELAAGQRNVIPLRLEAQALGVVSLSLDIAGPDDFAIHRDWQIAVRPAQPYSTQRIAGLLQPGQTLTIDRGVAEGYLADTVSVAASFSTRPNFDVPGLLRQLDAYPYGCVEQVTSRALPLLYVSEVAAETGARAPDDVRRRVQGAVNRVLTLQLPDGSFGTWTVNGQSEPWLTVYALDFLTRAREQGYDMPDSAWRRGITHLRDLLSYTSTRQDCRPSTAYAVYVLARADALGVSDLRYFADNCLARFGTPIARAQMAAAAARFGDRERTADGFRAALEARPDRVAFRDFGTALRDRAAVAALMAEAQWPLDAVLEQADEAAEAFNRTHWHSTQEMAWLLLAAHAVMAHQDPMILGVDGRRRESDQAPITLTPTRDQLVQGVRVENQGTGPVRRVISVRGVPAEEQPPEDNGFSLQRSFFTITGAPIDPREVPLHQGDRIVVRIEGRAGQTDIEHQALVVDLLPAGLEIENPALGGEADPGGYAGMLNLTPTAFTERRDDRFVAAVDVPAGGSRSFAVAYQARVVTPGEFVLPAAFVEDMYQPRYNGRTGMGRITIQPRD